MGASLTLSLVCSQRRLGYFSLTSTAFISITSRIGIEEASSGLGKQIPNSLTSFVYGSRHAFLPEAHLLQQHLAQICQELGGSCTQKHLLELPFRRHDQSKGGRQSVSNGGTEVYKTLVHQHLESFTAHEQGLSAGDVVYDCVFRLS